MASRRRGRDRDEMKARRAATGFRQRPRGQLTNTLPTIELLSADQIEAIHEVGPGGHIFGAAQTLERYETAFYAPFLSDWRNYETWSEDGAKSATRRAHEIYQRLLADYEPPPMAPEIAEELDAFVARRIEEGGAIPED